MDLYSKKSRGKLYLGTAGAIIVLISLFYTNYLAQQLVEQVYDQIEIVAAARTEITDPRNQQVDYTFPSQILQMNDNIPTMIVNDGKEIVDAQNFRKSDPEFLEKELRKIKKNGPKPLKVDDYGAEVYYKYPVLLTQLQYFPVVQLLLIAVFILFGYMTFSSARRAEQNRVWVGMAKETAHQLGTPISGMVAWIEHLKGIREEDEELEEILNELGNDVSRLELIADRFSKIGSAPKLDLVNIFKELEVSRSYMQRRASRKMEFQFPDPEQMELMVNINPPLFNWVVENLLRNALDAMGPKGIISARVMEDGEFVSIELSDTGKGIPSSKFKTVFQPGFTTKKRGWGLGLSLAKRIIEDYHKGKIFVKKSEEDKGTTFCIKLPRG